MRTWAVFFVILYSFSVLEAAKKAPKAFVQDISDHKEFKKLMKTKTNVLVYFFNKPTSSNVINVLREVADKIKGTGTIVSVDCAQGDSKKLCKKLKINLSNNGYLLKHYKDGDFHKDYDRLETIESMITFMKNPTGEAPWEEDEASANVQHLNDPKQFSKLLKNEKGKVLIMFYAPWCGFCKRMKPDYQQAATEIKGKDLNTNIIDNALVNHVFSAFVFTFAFTAKSSVPVPVPVPVRVHFFSILAFAFAFAVIKMQPIKSQIASHKKKCFCLNFLKLSS